MSAKIVSCILYTVAFLLTELIIQFCQSIKKEASRPSCSIHYKTTFNPYDAISHLQLKCTHVSLGEDAQIVKHELATAWVSIAHFDRE